MNGEWGSNGSAGDGYRIPPAPDQPRREQDDPSEPGRRRPARTTDPKEKRDA